MSQNAETAQARNDWSVILTANDVRQHLNRVVVVRAEDLPAFVSVSNGRVANSDRTPWPLWNGEETFGEETLYVGFVGVKNPPCLAVGFRSPPGSPPRQTEPIYYLDLLVVRKEGGIVASNGKLRVLPTTPKSLGESGKLSFRPLSPQEVALARSALESHAVVAEINTSHFADPLGADKTRLASNMLKPREPKAFQRTATNPAPVPTG